MLRAADFNGSTPTGIRIIFAEDSLCVRKFTQLLRDSVVHGMKRILS